MKPGKDVLWSTDIFKPAAPVAPPQMRGAAVQPPPVLPADPRRERAYLAFGRLVLQYLASHASDGARLGEIVGFLQDGQDVDFDEVRRVLVELERREAVELVEHDRRLGNHRYRLTELGRALAA